MRFYTTADLAAIPDLMQRSFTANLMRLQPNGNSPMFTLSGLAAVRKINAVSHSFWTKQALFPSLTLGAAVADGVATTFTVGDSSNAVPGGMYMRFNVSAGSYAAPEIVQVDSITDATTIEMIRGVGGTTAASIPDATVLIEIGNAHEEGSAMPTARAITMAEHTNFTQIFRDSWDITRTASRVAIEPDTTIIAENKEDAMFFHAQAIEWDTIFGRKAAGTKNGRPFRTMDGIESIVTQFAPSNIVAANTTTTYKQLEGFLHPTLDTVVQGRSNGRKTLFVGSQALETINEIGRASGNLQLQPETTMFGQQFHSFRTSRGTWELIEHPLLNAHASTKKMAIVADLNTIDFQYLDETMHEELANDGVDATSGVYTTELTIEMGNPVGWGIIHNLTAGA